MDKRPIWVTILSIICMVVFIGVVALYYIPHKPFSASFLLSILQALLDIILAFAIFCIAGGIGRRILADLHSNALANSVLQAALGIGLLALVYLVVGLLGLYKTWFAWSLLLVLILIFRQSILKWLGSLASIRATFSALSGFIQIRVVNNKGIVSITNTHC